MLNTWMVWNGLSCVLSTAARAVTRCGPDAPWRKHSLAFYSSLILEEKINRKNKLTQK